MTDEELRSLAYAMDTMSYKERIEALKARDAAIREDEARTWYAQLHFVQAMPFTTWARERIAKFESERRESDLGRPKEAHTQADIEGHGDDLWPEQTS